MGNENLDLESYAVFPLKISDFSESALEKLLVSLYLDQSILQINVNKQEDRIFIFRDVKLAKKLHLTLEAYVT